MFSPKKLFQKLFLRQMSFSYPVRMLLFVLEVKAIQIRGKKPRQKTLTSVGEIWYQIFLSIFLWRLLGMIFL